MDIEKNQDDLDSQLGEKNIYSDNESVFDGFEIEILNDQCTEIFGRLINALRISISGQILGIAHNQGIDLFLLKVQQFEQYQTLESNGPVQNLLFTHHDKYLVSVHLNQTVLWNLNTLQIHGVLNSQVSLLCSSINGDTLITSLQASITVWNMNSLEVDFIIHKAHGEDSIHSILYTNEHCKFITSSQKDMKLWEKSQCQSQLTVSTPLNINQSLNGQFVIVAGLNSIIIYRSSNLQFLTEILQQSSVVCLSNDNAYIAFYNQNDKNIKIYDTHQEKITKMTINIEEPIKQILFTKENSLILSVSEQQAVVWNLNSEFKCIQFQQ